MSMTGSIVCLPASVAPGESLHVEVFAPDGTSYRAHDEAVVVINGVTGAEQFLQFERLGTHKILVSVALGEELEWAVQSVSVVASPGLPTDPASPQLRALRLLSLRSDVGVPMLRIAQSPQNPYVVSFSVGQRPTYAAGLFTGPGAGQPRWRVDRALMARVPVDGERGGASLDLDPVVPDVNEAARAERAMVFNWDFGDGTSAQTTESYVEHDFEPALGPDAEHYNFHVRVRPTQPGSDALEIVRTISVFSAYVTCKRLGALIPKVRSSGYARRVFHAWQGSFTVENIEAFPLVLTSRRIQAIGKDGSGLDELGPPETLESPVEVPASGSASVTVTVLPSQVPFDAPGFIAHYGGVTAAGLPIRLEAQFDVAQVDRGRGAKVGDVAVSHLGPFLHAGTPVDAGGPHAQLGVGPPTSVSLSRPGSKTPAANDVPTHGVVASLGPSADRAAAGRVLDGVARAGLIDVGALKDRAGRIGPSTGERCDPDNLPDETGDWVCQATGETENTIVPSRFVNASKGDIVLSPGGVGVIGRLLLQVAPPQRYSHTGIMTRNYDQITHSTASEDRIQAYPVGAVIDGEREPTDGYRPDVVKYAWPGVVTQNVGNAIFGEQMLDPETAGLPDDQKKWYTISSFSPYSEGMDLNAHFEVVPPLVVKPDPMVETRELRLALHRIADAAAVSVGRSHYRFYCYTDPTIGQTTVAPPEAGWAAGTFPSVCSSFIWLLLKRAGVPLEGDGALVSLPDLEIPDRQAGAQIDDHTPDGLYLYTADERQAAATFLFESIHERVEVTLAQKAGILDGIIGLFTDIADDVANQITNAFASDWVDGGSKDSEAWNSTGAARAVSPDNILFWDAPVRHGLYGYAMPLHYVEARPATLAVSRWTKIAHRVRLSGTVRFQGAPIAGAMVQLYDGMTDFTDADGHYELSQVPVGRYTVTAVKDDTVMLTVRQPLDLPDHDTKLDIELHGPDELFRQIVIDGSLHIVDFEDLGHDEIADRPFHRDLFVGPYHTHDEKSIVEKMGGEVRVEVRIVADWQLDKTVHIWWELNFFEGGSEDTDDLDGHSEAAFDVPPDNWHSWNSHINSSNAGTVEMNVVFTNNVNPN